MGETYTQSSVTSGAVIGEDALLVNRRVASTSTLNQPSALPSEIDRKSKLDGIKQKLTKKMENVSTFARELVKTVNPVADGMNIIDEDDDEEEEIFKINTNFCCEVNEQTDLTNEMNLRDELQITHTTRTKCINSDTIDVALSGTFVRDIGVIKRTVSENGAIFNNLKCINNNNNYKITNVNNANNVNKSKSCVNMKLLFNNEDNIKKQNNSTPSRESSLENELEIDELWDHNELLLLNNEKPITKLNGAATRIAITNNLGDAGQNLLKDNNVEKEQELVDENNEIIETYESLYGKNLDYLEIREKVINECEGQRTMSGGTAGLNHISDQPCTVANGAACCSVM